jgi:hypothetical protein
MLAHEFVKRIKSFVFDMTWPHTYFPMYPQMVLSGEIPCLTWVESDGQGAQAVAILS